MTGLVYPQFSSTAVELSAPHAVGTEPVYNQVYQEQIDAGETTENIAEIPAVQKTGDRSRQFRASGFSSGHTNKLWTSLLMRSVIRRTIKASSTSTTQIDIPNSSSTSTTTDRLDELASMLDSCLTPLASLNEELEGLERLTKPEPPMLVVSSSATSSAKRRRRTRFSAVPGIMDHTVYLAPSVWPPIRHA